MERAKKILLYTLFAVLFMPILQKAFTLFKTETLHGEYTLAADVDFSWRDWFSGNYWINKSAYINDQIGFRPDLVRINNQYNYSLYHKLYSKWGIANKDHCLMQLMYIMAYNGEDYVGYPEIHEKVRKLRAIQDTLARLGKSLILVQAPCKAFYFPECIPDKYRVNPRGATNFETYARLADSTGLNQVNFNSWFVSMKQRYGDTIYTRTGLHWSVYGAMLGGDSIIRYIERLRHIHMIHPYWSKVEHTTVPRHSDDDIARALNLAIPFYKETYSYPVITYPPDKTAARPNMIFIGDSFLFQWMDQRLMDNTSSNWQIWYYFNTIYTRKYLSGAPQDVIEKYDWVGELNKADCIMILYTSHNLKKLGNGFIEQAYDHFYPQK